MKSFLKGLFDIKNWKKKTKITWVVVLVIIAVCIVLSFLKPSEADMKGSPFEKCFSALLKSAGADANVGELLGNGDSIQDIWDSLLPNTKLLQITGCSVEEMLYYVNRGVPVIAAKPDGSAVLFVGYDMLNVAVYEPVSGITSYHPLIDLQAEYDETTNKYYTYVQ